MSGDRKDAVSEAEDGNIPNQNEEQSFRVGSSPLNQMLLGPQKSNYSRHLVAPSSQALAPLGNEPSLVCGGFAHGL